MFDGLRLPATREPEPSKASEEELRRARRRTVERHARAVVSIFESFDNGHAANPDQVKQIREARKGLNALREYASHDLETAYKKAPSLAREAASGNFNRAMRAMQLEAEIRTDPRVRATNSSSAGTSCTLSLSVPMSRVIWRGARPFTAKWRRWPKVLSATPRWNRSLPFERPSWA